MSRPLRIEWPGGLYHVTSRGDRREPIVEDDVDRQAWVDLLGQTCERFRWRVHAWCLMSNHYHVLLETLDGHLSAGMRHLNGVWSQRFNRRHGRVGHVFQGRFKAIIVQRQSYLLELARYVVLNPVRAGMVGDAGAYPWSSYRAMVERTAPQSDARARKGCDWLETDWLLAQFSTRRDEAVRRYVDHVRAGVGLPSIWAHLQHEIYLGSPAFVARAQARLAAGTPLLGVPSLQRRPPPLPLDRWQADFPRDEAMARAYASGAYTQQALARHFEVSVATVSRAVAGARGVARQVAPARVRAAPASGAEASAGSPDDRA